MSKTQFWQYTDIDETTASLRFHGDVVSSAPINWWTGEQIEGDYITPEGFAEDMKKAEGKSVLEISINSAGGDAYVGLAISNMLSGLSAKKIVTIDGIAASAAATIACSADVLKMHAGSLLMIHNASVGLGDYLTQDELKQYARRLEAIEKASAAIYAKKSGLADASIRNMMQRETWFTGSEALESGFADELIGGKTEMTLNNADGALCVNGIGIDLNKIKVPQKILDAVQTTAPEQTAQVANITNAKQEVKIMDLEQIEKDFPEIVAQIRESATAKAVADERARIQGIEQIANTINDVEIVNNAKYVNPIDAKELAFQAMQNAAKSGKAFLDARAKEVAPASDVASAPAPDDKQAEIINKQKAESDAIERAVQLAKSIK